MAASRLARLWSLLAGLDLVMVLLWLGLAAFTVALIVLIWTRWGQYRPLRKCLLLSLLAHLLLAGYATTVQIVGLTPPLDGPPLHISYIEGPIGPGDGPGEPGTSPAPEGTATSLVATADPPDAGERQAAAMPEPPRPMQPAEPPADQVVENRSPPEVPDRVESSTPAAPANPSPEPVKSADPPASTAADEPVVGGPGYVPSNAQTSLPTDQGTSGSNSPSGNQTPARQAGSTGGNSDGRANTAGSLPEVYKLRVAPDHGLGQGGGGSPETEAAVKAALAWLADNQGPDGRWDASQHEAGRESMTDGHNRRGAGVRSDTGMTGLALLAFLASGHTHLHGPYQENVRRGLEYLLRTQDAGGSLAGAADAFAMMYCHAMAAFALSEAYGMTGDQRLHDAVRRAIDYTIAAQDPRGGGWRYRPGDAGDTSQLGWQFMALKSAELAGIPIPQRTRDGIIRYLRSVANGSQGGLASYRPGEPISRTMTAEALLCWQFLGLTPQHPVSSEAGDYLLGDPPADNRVNIYYWYYATLALYQSQGEHWQRWEAALRPQLLASQRKSGPLTGTWDPDPIWGAYGGRIYSTSLATLCLEVYYRYLPLYAQAATGRQMR